MCPKNIFFEIIHADCFLGLILQICYLHIPMHIKLCNISLRYISHFVAIYIYSVEPQGLLQYFYFSLFYYTFLVLFCCRFCPKKVSVGLKLSDLITPLSRFLYTFKMHLSPSLLFSSGTAALTTNKNWPPYYSQEC